MDFEDFLNGDGMKHGARSMNLLKDQLLDRVRDMEDGTPRKQLILRVAYSDMFIGLCDEFAREVNRMSQEIINEGDARPGDDLTEIESSMSAEFITATMMGFAYAALEALERHERGIFRMKKSTQDSWIGPVPDFTKLSDEDIRKILGMDD